MRAHEIDYRIIGDDIQLLEIGNLVQALSPYGKNIRKEGRSILGGLFEQ